MPLLLRKTLVQDIAHIKEILSSWMKDAKGVVDKKQVSFFTQEIEEGIENLSLQRGCFLGIREDGKPIGILSFQRNISPVLHDHLVSGAPIQITLLMIHKEYAGLGYGHMLLSGFESWCRENDFSEIILTSSIVWQNSWDFYHREGYVRIGSLTRDEKVRAAIFVKPLEIT